MAKSVKNKKRTIRSHRHAFRFKFDDGQTITSWAKVIAATHDVELVLTKEHIKKSLELNGQGNTQSCAMAVCSKEHGSLFPHPFEFVDWMYKRAYFVTKKGKDGLPSECVVYSHHDDVAPLFDTTSGMKKLLKIVERDGSKTIKLYPPRVYVKAVGRAAGKRTGANSPTIKAKGAALRFARLQLGGVPA